MTNENATYDECSEIDAFVKKAIDKHAYVKKTDVNATVVDKTQEHDELLSHVSKDTFVKENSVSQAGVENVVAPALLGVGGASKADLIVDEVKRDALFVNDYPYEAYEDVIGERVDNENFIINGDDVELEEDFTGNHAINEAFLVNKKTDKNPLIVDPKQIQTELLVNKKDVHEELFASSKRGELMVDKQGIHEDLFAGTRIEEDDVRDRLADVKEKNNLHTLTGDVKDGAVRGVKQGAKNVGKKAVSETVLAPVHMTDKLVRNTEGEEAQEALSVLTGTKIKDGVEQVKDYYNKAMSPFAAVGKVARAPRRVGEVRATIKEHRATRKVKSADRKVRRVDKRIGKYQKRELQGKAGYKKGAEAFEKKNKKTLAKARKQAGRASAKFQKAKFIRAKKRPVAWLFDGRAKSPAIKVLIPVFGGLLLFLLLMSAVMSVFSGIAATTEEKKDGGELTGNALKVYQRLSKEGYSNIAIAAILGNLQRESGINPKSCQDGKEYDDYPPEYINDNFMGYGMAQWTWYTRSQGLVDLAASQHKHSGDYDVQEDYLVYELNGYSEVAPGSDFATKETDLGTATYLFLKVFEMSNQEPPSGEAEKRTALAQTFYDQITAGGGEINDGTLDETQKRIVEACYSTPPAGINLCATWVSNVYQNAGCVRPTGQQGGCDNPDDNWYTKYCFSSNKSDLKPGMIVCVPSNDQGSAGKIYGHVGIYVGNGKVMDCVSAYVRTIDLDAWIDENDAYYAPKWGFAF